MACVAMLQKNVKLAFALLLGFVGLLRTGEILDLLAKNIRTYGNPLLVVSLPDSKGASRSGNAETVMVRDPLIVLFGKALLKNLNDDDFVLGGTWHDLNRGLQGLASKFGVRDPRLTPYCLRRGGATWHFTTFCSYDQTQSLGRWNQAKTARIYIDQATAEISNRMLPERGKARMVRAVRGLPWLVRAFCEEV